MVAYDVIIIRTGTGGGTLARHLAPSGKRALLLGARRLASARALLPRHGAHQAGTCRFGTDPAASALNTNCRAHELNNLYVVNTSVFPSIGAMNSALTAMANALRVGDQLLTRLA